MGRYDYGWKGQCPRCHKIQIVVEDIHEDRKEIMLHPTKNNYRCPGTGMSPVEGTIEVRTLEERMRMT